MSEREEKNEMRTGSFGPLEVGVGWVAHTCSCGFVCKAQHAPGDIDAQDRALDRLEREVAEHECPYPTPLTQGRGRVREWEQEKENEMRIRIDREPDGGKIDVLVDAILATFPEAEILYQDMSTQDWYWFDSRAYCWRRRVKGGLGPGRGKENVR